MFVYGVNIVRTKVPVPKRNAPARARRLRAKGDLRSLRHPILDTARKLFAKEGYACVSMRRIGAEVGCSPMAMYRYFASKEDLLISICEETFAQLTQAEEAEGAKQTTPLEKLRATVHAFIQFCISHPYHFKLTFMADLPPGPVARRRAVIAHKAMEGLRNRVRECALHKGGDIDVELATQMLRIGVLGTVMGAVIKRNTWKDTDRVLDHMVRTLTRDLE